MEMHGSGCTCNILELGEGGGVQICDFPRARQECETACILCFDCERCSGLIARVLDSGVSGPGSSPGRGHCVVFLGKTRHSHSASLYSDV